MVDTSSARVSLKMSVRASCETLNYCYPSSGWCPERDQLNPCGCWYRDCTRPKDEESIREALSTCIGRTHATSEVVIWRLQTYA